MSDVLRALIPRSILFGNPERASPRFSPDGTRISFLTPVDGVLNVWVGSRDGNGARPVTRDRGRGVRVYAWAHDNRHVLYLQDREGDENWRLYLVDPETGTERLLTPFDGVQVRIIGHAKQHPGDLIIGMNKEDPHLHDAYRLDLQSGQLSLVADNPGSVFQWLPDADLNVRAAVASRGDGGVDLLLREDEQSEWECAITWGRDDALGCRPVTFSRDGRSLYLKESQGSGTTRLVRWIPRTGARVTIAEDPCYDVEKVLVHPDTYEPEMVSFVKARREWRLLSSRIAADVEGLRSLHPGDFTVASRTHADDAWVVLYEQDTSSPSYYTFDRTSRTGRFLFDYQSSLSEYELSPMEPISFRSRDGLTIHGYLTIPAGAEPSRLPTVLKVHGGPWVRDTWRYDPVGQWLANRGYAVLQVNFRGSTGYGKRFLNAGNREWGGRMHDDLVDALQWAVARGIADPDRAGVYGGSYGGYAALVGATMTPELFRCAVVIVGPSNLITFLESIPPYWTVFRSLLWERVGDPESDREFLESRSPLSHVDRIRIPMLIAQGANDPRVKRSEAEQIVAAMRDKKIDHEYILFPDEGHGFAKPENRLRFYARAEEFLSKHLGGRHEAGQ